MVSVSSSMLDIFYPHPSREQIACEGASKIVRGRMLGSVSSGITFDDDICRPSRRTQYPSKSIARPVPSHVTAPSTDPFHRLIERFKPPGSWFLKRNSFDLPRLLVTGKIDASQIAGDPVTSGDRLKAEPVTVVESQPHQPCRHGRTLERFSVLTRFGATGNTCEESLDLFGCERSSLGFALTAVMFSRALSGSLDLGKQSRVLAVPQDCPHRRHRRIDGGNRKTSIAKTRLKIEHVPSAEFAALYVTKVLREFAKRLITFFDTAGRHPEEVIAFKPRDKHDPRSRDSGSIQLVFEFQPCRIDMVSMSSAPVELLLSRTVNAGPSESYSITRAFNDCHFDFHISGGDASHASSAFAER